LTKDRHRACDFLGKPVNKEPTASRKNNLSLWKKAGAMGFRRSGRERGMYRAGTFGAGEKGIGRAGGRPSFLEQGGGCEFRGRGKTLPRKKLATPRLRGGQPGGKQLAERGKKISYQM